MGTTATCCSTRYDSASESSDAMQSSLSPMFRDCWSVYKCSVPVDVHRRGGRNRDSSSGWVGEMSNRSDW